MKKSDILEKIQNLVSLLEDDLNYDHVKFTIEVRNLDRYQRYSYDVDEDDI